MLGALWFHAQPEPRPNESFRLQVVGCLQKAILAYEKAAEANLRGSGTAWHAAKHLEAAAQQAKALGELRTCADLARRAAGHYVDAGKASTGAEALGRAARWLEDSDPSLSGKLYTEAVQLYSKDSMASMAHDIVQRGVKVQVKAAQFEDAATMLMEWASICSATGSGPYLCRAYLGGPLLSRHLYVSEMEANLFAVYTVACNVHVLFLCTGAWSKRCRRIYRVAFTQMHQASGKHICLMLCSCERGLSAYR